MRVLVTGGSGWTAAPTLRRLAEEGHEGVVYDIVRPQGLPPGWSWSRGDVRDPDALTPALVGSDAVLHMAVAVGPERSRSAHVAFDVNVRGTYEVFRTARDQGVRRMVLVGSAPVHLPAPPDGGRERAHWRSDPGEDHLYDLTKRLQEEIARDFASTFGMSTLVLRAGHVVDGPSRRDRLGRPLSELAYCRGGWVCRYDLAEALTRAVTSPHVGRLTLVGARPGRRRFGSTETERILGFRLEHDFADYAG